MPPTDRTVQRIAGSEMADNVVVGKQDLPDWVELMEAVEALCPEWPPHVRLVEGKFKL